MPADQQEPQSGDFAQIKPVAIQLTPPAPGSGSAGGARRGGISPAVWIGLSLLLLAALLVTFVLPGRMKPPAPPVAKGDAGAATTASTQHAAPATPATAQPAAGPFSDAQQSQLRRESQDLLQEALDIQKSLQQISVESWAPADYAAAVKLAQTGDTAYRGQDFAASKAAYEQALAGFKALQTRAEQVHAESMESGRKALAEGQSATATQAFRTALTIRPDDSEATSGLKRAGTLDQMLSLIAQGDTLVQQDKLDEARQKYGEAAALDPDAPEPKRQTALLDQVVARRKFSAAMSEGYAALERGELEKAAGSFRNATAIMPEASEARGALNQTQQKITTVKIGKYLNEAAQLEQEEKWQEALQRYDAALALDPNLPQARQGKEHAARRVSLDDRLRAAIARPERLADDAVRADAQSLQLEAAAVSAPGTTLKKQIVVLGSLIEQAVIPVNVTLRSDGATNVTVYKVGAMGQFESRELPLRPGNYIAVGKRPGYRDVRVEFSVTGDAAPAPVTIVCSQKIN